MRPSRYGTLAVVLMLAWAAQGEAQYRMLVNHGAGWSAAGDFKTLTECEGEAKIYAAKFSAQAGCAAVSALEFQQTAAECAKRTGVQIFFKPGLKVSYLGNLDQRFAFEKCMAERGQPTETLR